MLLFLLHLPVLFTFWMMNHLKKTLVFLLNEMSKLAWGIKLRSVRWPVINVHVLTDILGELVLLPLSAAPVETYPVSDAGKSAKEQLPEQLPQAQAGRPYSRG